jgi:hypothetical protein
MATEVYECRLNGIHQTQWCQNVLHFQGVGTDPTDPFAGAQSLCDGVVANLKSPWLGMLPITYTFMSIQTRRISAKPSITRFKSYLFGTEFGGRGSLGESYQLCPSLFLVPTMGAKSGGKIFLPAVAQADIISNALQTAYKTAIQSFITALIAGFTQAGITWASGVWSKKTRTFSATTAAQISPLLGYQKRRRAPGGAD